MQTLPALAGSATTLVLSLSAAPPTAVSRLSTADRQVAWDPLRC
jgi:hypothetical protein